MQIIIAPARTMTVDNDSLPTDGVPHFLPQAEEILAWMRTLTYDELHRLWWNCSTRLAEKNYRWLQKMDLHHQLTPALLAFTGLQYQYMAPDVFSEAGLTYVKAHLRILSGFYGLLRPFDGIVPYRLGMGDRATVAGTKNLYQFWGSRLADSLFESDDLVLDLASVEYEKAITPYLTGERQLVKCVFAKEENGKIRQLSTQSKMARGNMVRYLAEGGINDLAGVKRFAVDGFCYRPDLSQRNRLIFIQNK